MLRQGTIEQGFGVSATRNLVSRGDASVPCCLCSGRVPSLRFVIVEEVTLLYHHRWFILCRRRFAAAWRDASCRRSWRRKGLLRESARTVIAMDSRSNCALHHSVS